MLSKEKKMASDFALLIKPSRMVSTCNASDSSNKIDMKVSSAIRSAWMRCSTPKSFKSVFLEYAADMIALKPIRNALDLFPLARPEHSCTRLSYTSCKALMAATVATGLPPTSQHRTKDSTTQELRLRTPAVFRASMASRFSIVDDEKASNNRGCRAHALANLALARCNPFARKSAFC